MMFFTFLEIVWRIDDYTFKFTMDFSLINMGLPTKDPLLGTQEYSEISTITVVFY